MNDDIDKIYVTIAEEQFIISYKLYDQVYIFGDTAISYLREQELGKTDEDFYLVLFLKK